ncbi:hypothetical protein [Streptomyces cadmiisoli]|uniref:Uncharacterized protein n=1 Tax=Streptomyces cadmiisoli TaxID=2184053 RepID=A0A2Z4JDZ9_9ACTN|nr:hypothetical protein [Streptomyces cadmiisoli]AWW43325.1 hypothetical protein DN051_42905 [Streptomyces cadmiisoli]
MLDHPVFNIIHCFAYGPTAAVAGVEQAGRAEDGSGIRLINVDDIDVMASAPMVGEPEPPAPAREQMPNLVE